MFYIKEKTKIYWQLLRGFTLFAPFVGVISGGFIALFVLDLRLSALLFLRIVSCAFAAAILNGASNALNQYFDIGIDRINKPERPIVKGKISKQKTLRVVFLLYIISIAVPLFVSLNPLLTFIFYLAALILTVFYSVPPLRTKRFTWGSNLTIALARGFLLIVAGWSVVSLVNSFEPWILGFIFGTFVFFTASTKDLGDVKGDGEFKIKTIPVVFSEKFSYRFISLGFIIPFLMLLFLGCFDFLSADSYLVISLALMLLCWGLYNAYCLNKSLLSYNKLWRQMYYIMMVFQVGLVFIYYLS